VFKGWSEEKIYFAPTYKYTFNSDSYSGETATSKKKRRTPAWYLSSSFLQFIKGCTAVSIIYGPKCTIKY
jgi:hypothetical protein